MVYKLYAMQNISQLTGLEFDLKETLQLLKSPITIFWSWGVSQILTYKGKGLFLKVSANHFQGWTFITLDYSDTYTVSLLNKNFRVVETHKGIYADQLQFFIDRRIEFIPTYIK